MDRCTYDICIKQGANFYQQFYIVDEVDGVEVPTDLTDYTVEMQIRRTVENSTIFATYSTANGLITLDESNGIITINVPAATTAAYQYDFEGVYDIEITAPITGFVERVLQGKLIVDGEVTR
ncbi:MAG: hypothetical protein JRJ39_00330 [Deltaproteobacteria bacterium]|nr:hypothetical protein [Deltaproteobacteria bacterium]